MTELIGIVYKWEEIGAELGVSFGELKTIEANVGNNMQKRLREVLATWLHGNAKPATWKTLIDALNSPAVKEKDLAAEIKSRVIEKALNDIN